MSQHQFLPEVQLSVLFTVVISQYSVTRKPLDVNELRLDRDIPVNYTEYMARRRPSTRVADVRESVPVFFYLTRIEAGESAIVDELAANKCMHRTGGCPRGGRQVRYKLGWRQESGRGQ